jgi:hypothetical protein
VLGLALPLWLAWRLPDLERRLDRTLLELAAPAPVVVAQAIPPVIAPHAAAQPVVSQTNTRPHRLLQPPRQRPVAAPMVPQPERPAAIALTLPPVAEAPVAQPAPQTTAYDIATRAYARLAAGDRRGAAADFAEAIAIADSADPLRENWQRERDRLNRRWSGDAFALFRDAGSSAPAASPVLGGGQSGASLAYALDPLARRPLALFGRLYAAHDSRSRIDGSTAQAAIGLRWQAAPGLSVAAERLIALGGATTGDWNLRLAGGGERRRGRLVLAGYGEAGVRGNGDAYAGGQTSAMTDIASTGRLVFSAGPGVWGSIQAAETTVSRLDIGIGLAARLPVGVAIAADWRWRIAGNADPGSGPAVTLSAAF